MALRYETQDRGKFASVVGRITRVEANRREKAKSIYLKSQTNNFRGAKNASSRTPPKDVKTADTRSKSGNVDLNTLNSTDIRWIHRMKRFLILVCL